MKTFTLPPRDCVHDISYSSSSSDTISKPSTPLGNAESDMIARRDGASVASFSATVPMKDSEKHRDAIQHTAKYRMMSDGLADGKQGVRAWTIGKREQIQKHRAHNTPSRKKNPTTLQTRVPVASCIGNSSKLPFTRRRPLIKSVFADPIPPFETSFEGMSTCHTLAEGNSARTCTNE